MISNISEEEKKRISEQHKVAMKKHQEKVDNLKKGLQEPKKAV